MNSYIISQWYKYRKDLLKFYRANIFGTKSDPDSILDISEQMCNSPLCNECKGEKAFCDICPTKGGDLADFYDGKCYDEIAEDLIRNLLTIVINRGEDNLALSYEDVTVSYGEGCCYDAIFLLRDKDGDMWTMKIFFGSYDTMMPIPARTKQEWLSVLMHFSLNMVQSITPIGGNVSQTLMIMNDGVSECGIQSIISLKDMSKISGYQKYCVYDMLRGMTYESLKSLFLLMTNGQIMEIQDILAEDDEDGDLIREILTTGYSPLITAMISSRNADKLISKLAEYNLEGYMAICKKSNSLERGLTTAIDNSRHTDEDPYQWIERIEKETDVNPYFIAVGDSLEQLIQDINKKSRT